MQRKRILWSQTNQQTIEFSYEPGDKFNFQKVKLTIHGHDGQQCNLIYRVNRIVMENIQFNYYTDFGLANFAVSSLTILNHENHGSSDSALPNSEEIIPCSKKLDTWKLVSRNAKTSLGFRMVLHKSL